MNNNIIGLATMTPEVQYARNYYAWIFSVIEPFLGHQILEIGAGYGNIASMVSGKNRHYTGIDLDSEVIMMLRNKFSEAPNISFIEADINNEAAIDRLLKLDIDTVISMNVLEHIEDAENHIAQILKVLRKGNIFFFLPAHKFLFGSMDVEAGHFRRYSKKDLRILLGKFHLRIIKLCYFNSIGAFGWFISGRIFKQKINSRTTGSMAMLFDKFIVPCSKWIDKIFSPFFGQSIICVVEKN